MKIRPLLREDDTSGFTCGEPELDYFFVNFAVQEQFKSHIGATHVAVEDGKLIGYVTVAPGKIEIDNLPDELKKRFPGYPLPVLRLARIAVATEEQGQGLGADLLYATFTLALSLPESVGCMGVVVDAKPVAVDWYSKFGFIPLPSLAGVLPARPPRTPMFLALANLRAVQPKPDIPVP